MALLTAHSWATDELVPGTLAVVKSGVRVKFVSRSRPQLGAAPFVLPATGSADDPTIHGATLAVADVGLVAGSVEYALDASGWRGLGQPPGSAGYRYRGKDDAQDPNPAGTCRTAVLKERLIKAECGVDVPLSTPFADATQVVLGMGASPTGLRYCAEFGGDEQKNDSAVMRRKDAPPPPTCPVTECPVIEFLPTTEVAGACWYPAPETSCDEVCTLAGLRYSEATRTFAGSDGTEANCNAVLNGFAGGPFSGAMDADCESLGLSGIGCFTATEFPGAFRCTTPPTTADAMELGSIRVCACR